MSAPRTFSDPMPLTLVVPGLLSQPAERLRACTPFAALAGDARMTSVRQGLDGAVLSALAIDAPVAPLRASGAGLGVGDAYWLCADPAVLVAGRDDLRLLARVDDLSGDEAQSLRATLDAHFADDGLAFHAPRADAWFVSLQDTPALTTVPLDEALGRPLIPSLPQGDDARTWQRWQTEIQMLLHAHPVNAAREARGQAPVTGVWFWGGGRMPSARPGVPATWAATGRVGDLARGIAALGGTAARELPQRLAAIDARDALVALAPVASEGDLARCADDWLSPANARLDDGASERVRLVADGAAVTAIWDRAARSGWRRWMPRARGTALTLPEREP